MINKEDFKVIPKFPSYGVGKCGEILRFSSEKILSKVKQGKKKYKYHAVRLGLHGKIFNVKVQDKFNNRVDNLEWLTAAENIRHAVQTELKQKGEKLYNASVTDEQVHEICRLLQDNLTVKDIAERYDITKDAVRKIRAGDTYFHIRSLYTINNNYISDFSESTVRWVCSQIVQGKSDETDFPCTI